jgi:hypothetical protein
MKHNNQIDLPTKNVDSNRTAIFQYMDDGDIVIHLARILPENE